MTLRKKKIENFRVQLLDRRETLAANLRKMTTQLIDDEPQFADSLDQASAEADKEVSLRIKAKERELMFDIDLALNRIEAGTFGSCEQCDEPISEARLKASLFTTLCIDCKSEIEFRDRARDRIGRIAFSQ